MHSFPVSSCPPDPRENVNSVTCLAGPQFHDISGDHTHSNKLISNFILGVLRTLQPSSSSESNIFLQANLQAPIQPLAVKVHHQFCQNTDGLQPQLHCEDHLCRPIGLTISLAQKGRMGMVRYAMFQEKHAIFQESPKVVISGHKNQEAFERKKQVIFIFSILFELSFFIFGIEIILPIV